MSNDYSNWCPEIYRGLFIDKFNDNLVRVAPCCQAKTQLESVESFDFKTSPYLTRLRQQFDLDQQPSECARCWKVEQLGHKSRRQSTIDFYQDSQPNRTVELQSVEHSATWACNLACVMCEPVNSSLWAKQNNLSRQQLHQMGRLFQRSNNILNNIDVGQLKKIHFNGGEPLLNEEPIDFLLKLEEQGILQNVFISYNTNGTVMPSKKIIDLWSKTQLVKIFFSIDAVGSAFDYIRWPANWKQTSKNILDMKQNLPNNVMFGFNSTVANYNLLEMSEVYQWFEHNIKHNRDGDESDFCWQFVMNIDDFDIKYLPHSIKHTAIQQLQSMPVFDGLVKYLETTMDHIETQRWINKLNSLDSKRNTSWKNSLAISQFIKETTC